MAQIHPFHALRYATEKAGALENLVTQPYDKISPRMLERYRGLSPYNLSNIIKTTDYQNAARLLREWTAAGVLTADARPAMYPYFQTYRVPGSNEVRTRKGFIAAGGLEPYANGPGGGTVNPSGAGVYRHEQTLSGPKQDRLALLRATRVHFGQIFMLYSDPAGEVDRLLDPGDTVPIEQLCDEYGVEHRVWSVDDSDRIHRVQQAMAPKNLLIADGHHRYETALAFRDECRASQQHREGGRCEAVMMTFVNMDAPGLTILPTHRVLSGLPGFDRTRFLDSVSRFFDVTRPDAAQLRRELPSHAAGQAIGVALAGAEPEICLLRLKPEADLASLLPGVSPEQRRLDVVVLHQLLLGQCLGVSEEAVRQERFLEYVREFDEGLDRVRRGAAACFFLNPVPIEQVRDISFSGGVMPQKSTDFYPKMLSGLAGYRVED